MIQRRIGAQEILRALGRSPISALLGPRQCGKTTLAGQVAQELRLQGQEFITFDCESPTDRQRLENPLFALEERKGLVILDEIQALPELFPVLRVLADREGDSARFLILGSASPSLVKQASESLAGRVEFVELGGFTLEETGSESLRKLWNRGGFPRSFLAASDEDSYAWRAAFARTFLERDIPALGIGIAPAALARFWTMLAHSHGQLWNASELSRSMALSDKTVRSYLDLLTGTFMIRQLQPWYANTAKRQVKAPKIYFRDSGILHSLLGLPDDQALFGHPRCGASWEGFALEQTIGRLHPEQAWFWSTHGGPELDLLLMIGGKRYGFEFKLSDAPKTTASMRHAMDTLSLDRLFVVVPGARGWEVDKDIEVLPLENLIKAGRECLG